MESTEEVIWYAMRATYRREIKVKQLLDEVNIESFIPMRYETCVENRQKIRKQVPAIRSLIFVRTTPTIIKQIKSKLPYLQYMMKIEDSKKSPIIISKEKMQQFIAVVNACDDQIVYLNPEEVNVKKGTKVRIHGGVLDGQEGLFVKVKGIKNKRFVILIQGVVAVTIKPDLIELVS